MVTVEKIKYNEFSIKHKGKTIIICFRPSRKVTEYEVKDNFPLLWDLLVNKKAAIDSVKFWGQNNFVLISFTFWKTTAVEYFKYFSDAYVAKRFFNDSPRKSCEFFEYIESILDMKNFYGNKHKMLREQIKDIYYQSYRKEAMRNILRCIKKNQKLVKIVNVIGIQEVLRISFQELPELISKYIMHFAGLFTERREKITYLRVMQEIFGRRLDAKDACDVKIYIKKIRALVNAEYLNQCEVFVKSNINEISIDNNLWRTFYPSGPGIIEKVFDFSRIKASGIRAEVKHYMKNQLLQSQNYGTTILDLMTTGFNCLYEKNSSIVWCKDIAKVDIRGMLLYLQQDFISDKNGRKLSISTIKGIVGVCRQVVDFVILNHKKLGLKSPASVNNPFNGISFHNMNSMKKNTVIIPDKVAEEIYSKIDYLNPRYRLMYRIFMNTGLRLKEVAHLEADCLQPTQYENVKYLKYIPYKVLNNRRKRGLSDYKKIPIPKYLADRIQRQIDESKKLRMESETQYIFISKPNRCTPAVIRGRNFTSAVNRLIEKYEIKDESGKLWNFSSRQLRKTLVAEMIENGATTTEVAYWLGHMSEKTTRIYYEEIKKMKLADLNAEFFSNNFDVIMKKEQAEKFTPAERKALYIDFKLNYRRVELGHCMKHYSESPCSYLSGKTKCAVCPNLCTGVRYLKEWRELLNSQKDIVRRLEELYAEKHISNYLDFKEYQIEIYLLKAYQNVVDLIEKEGNIVFEKQ